MDKRESGELEMAILRLIKPGEKTTVKEIHQLLDGHDKYTTVMTVMVRLVEKKMLERERVGLHYEYRLKKDPAALIKKKLGFFKPIEMLCHLLGSAEPISDEDIQQMEAILDKYKKQKQK